ncbi:Arm DNA-binding domain-containing protein [Kordia sp.]|uniref:Arm DNA-binding domain-containing protein n=1 Tax=Kordia sp. TaxID=1965332 RepID=UPI00344C128E
MRTQSSFALLFWIEAPRTKDNQGMVYARVTVNRKRVNISLKRKVNISDWDSTSGKV